MRIDKSVCVAYLATRVKNLVGLKPQNPPKKASLFWEGSEV